jgi:hypothetical protein
MADSPEPERELDGDAASKAVSEAFNRARLNLSGGRHGGKTDALSRGGWTEQDWLTLDRIEQTLTTIDAITTDDAKWLIEQLTNTVKAERR